MNRAGMFMKQQGYSAFIPSPLPPDPSININGEMLNLLSLADRKLGRLDGITQILPNPELFVAMYVKKEAVLSSQIEGTQASLIDILEENDESAEIDLNVKEVISYIDAMYKGLTRLETLPLSLRLIKEIHSVLLREGRGSNKNPGEFRESQNWIGPAGVDLMHATFVPPPVYEMKKAMGQLEKFMHAEDDIPALIKIGLVHAQFETIHPFLDGNGRMGRLLIAFWLCQQEILTKPLLYLSYYFKQNRTEYYDRLMDVRVRGNWEDWLKFFLKGVAQVSDEAISSARGILTLKEFHSKKLYEISSNANYQRVLDLLFEHPVITVNKVAELINVTYPTANAIVNDFVSLEILKPTDVNRKRNKRYSYYRYLAILNKGTEL
jgi:Fic family protein